MTMAFITSASTSTTTTIDLERGEGPSEASPLKQKETRKSDIRTHSQERESSSLISKDAAPSSAAVPAAPSDSNTQQVVLSVLSYALVSLAIVYFNWWLFTQSFKYPVFVSWTQQVLGIFLFMFFSWLGGRDNSPQVFRRFVVGGVNWASAKKVLPLSATFVGMVGFSNLCLRYVQVSTYQVARSLTIFFTMGLTYLLLGQSQSRKTVMACSLLVLGFLVASLDTTNLSVWGMAAGGVSSFFQGLYNVTIKRTLPAVGDDTNRLLLYNMVISSILFVPAVIACGEGGVFWELPLHPWDPNFWTVWMSLCVSGLLASAMNLSSYICVQVTSPLTFNIVGFTKSVLQSLGGVVFLGDSVSISGLVGIIFSITGSFWYSQVKYSESKLVKQNVTHVDDADSSTELQSTTLSPAAPYGDRMATPGSVLSVVGRIGTVRQVEMEEVTTLKWRERSIEDPPHSPASESSSHDDASQRRSWQNDGLVLKGGQLETAVQEPTPPVKWSPPVPHTPWVENALRGAESSKRV